MQKWDFSAAATRQSRVATGVSKSPLSNVQMTSTKVKVLYWSHIHNVQWNLFSAFNPSLRSSGQSQHSTQDQLQILSQCLGQGCWVETDLMYGTCFNSGGNRSTQRKPTQTRGRTCKLHVKRPYPTQESNPGPSRYEATVLTTTPPCHPKIWR